MQNRIVPTRFYVVGALIGLLLALVVTAKADAHHATASKITSGVYWTCKTNYARPLANKKRSERGTTRKHTHIRKPSKNHMKRHKCKRVVKRAKPTPAPAPIVQTIEKIVFVDRPCPICPADPPKPQEQDECECNDTHEHQRGEGHRKCRGYGHRK